MLFEEPKASPEPAPPRRGAFFREAFDHAPIGMGVLSPSGDWLKANGALLRMLDHSLDTLLGNPLVETLHPDDAARDLARIGQLLAGESEAFSLEQRLRRRNGSYVTVQMNLAPVRNDEGRLTALIAQVLDIEPFKEAEAKIREANEGLKQQNRELQEFAYIASHDLQEPLRKIRAFGDRLRERCGDSLSEQGMDYLQRMRAAAGRMQVLIEDLLAYSRAGTQKHPFTAVELDAIAQHAIQDLETRIEECNARIEVAPLPTIQADPAQMRQLFQNLLSNSLKYARPGVPPVVTIRASAMEALPETDPTPHCRIEFADNGIGFDEKYLDRIFTAFQRLHGRDEYQGTGIGLAICRKIVDRHHGTLTARSQPGAGATFIVTLPVHTHSATNRND